MYSLNTSTNEYHKSQRLELYLEQIKYQDSNALANFYEEVRVPVYNFALSIVKSCSLAEDILQETIIKVYEASEKYQSKGHPMAWVLTITRNLSLMKLRESSKITELDEVTINRLTKEEKISQDEKILLETTLLSLSEEERQIITLNALTGLKHREIASIMNLPLATVLSKYHRALKKLKQKMEGEDNEK